MYPAAVQTMERQRVGVMTRTMRKVWQRGIRFDGSKKAAVLQGEMNDASLTMTLEEGIDKVVIDGCYAPVSAIDGLRPDGQASAPAATLGNQRATHDPMLSEQTPARKRLSSHLV